MKSEGSPEGGIPPVQLIRLNEAAVMLAVSVKWIRANRRTLPFVRDLSGTGRLLRVDVTAMNKWQERKRPM